MKNLKDKTILKLTALGVFVYSMTLGILLVAYAHLPTDVFVGYSAATLTICGYILHRSTKLDDIENKKG